MRLRALTLRDATRPPDPKPFSGYAYRSSARYPREATVTLISVDPSGRVEHRSTIEGLGCIVPTSYRGTATIDGSLCDTWIIRPAWVRPYYIHQLASMRSSAQKG